MGVIKSAVADGTKEMATKGELLASAINVNECLKPDPESSTLELDVVLDALGELSGEDGG